MSATVEMTAEAEEAAVAAEASRRRTHPRLGRSRGLLSTGMLARACSVESCAIPDVIATAREDAVLSTTGNTR